MATVTAAMGMVTPATAIERIESYWRRCQNGEFPGDHMVRRLVNYYKACERGLVIIRDQHAQHIPLRLNEIQCRAHAAALDQAAAGKPIRISILKARKGGISTWSETLFVFLCGAYEHQRAMTIAHEGRATQEIFEIAQRAAESGDLALVMPAKITSEIDWPVTDSHYHAMTAGGTAVGSGGTPSCLHLSEGPKWEKNKEETFTSALNAVPSVPETIVIHEFTANGRETFYNLFDEARQAESHRQTHPYKAVFIAWYLDERCTVEAPIGFQPDEEEQRLVRRAKQEGIELSNGQLQWRREKIAVIGLADFRREYPSTPEEAIQSAEGLIFPNMRDSLVAEIPFDSVSVMPADKVGGIDFGYSPDPTVIWSGYYLNGHLWIDGYWRSERSLAVDQEPHCRPFTTYYRDPTSVQEGAELSRACQRAQKHCYIVAAPRHKNPGEEIERIELKLIEKMIREERLHILYSVAAQLIVECDTLAWDEKTGRANLKRTDATSHYDAVMALRYLVMGVMSREIVKPKEAERKPPTRRQMGLAT